MRSDRKKQEKREYKEMVKEAKKNSSSFAKFTKIWGLIFFGLTVLTIAGLALANILATKYLLIAGLLMLLLLVIIVPTLYSYKTKTGQRWIAFILSIIVSVVYIVGARYLMSTMDFMSKVTNVTSEDEYLVVVRDDDMFAVIDDIVGENVHAYQSGAYEKAIEVLKSKVDVEVTPERDIAIMIDNLLTGEINVTLMNSGIYNTLKEENESFQDYTKILDRFKVAKEVIDISKPVTVVDEAFNVYVTGVDTEGMIDVSARSDVNMVATINPVTKTILLTSIPRDYYVLLPDAEAYDKLTHTGVAGANYTVETVEKLLDIDINYYVKVNFTTVVTLVDVIDGLDINSELAFVSKDGTYFEEGVNHVDGETALKFARERYAFVDGDFQRNRNQQIVLEALIKKVTQSSTLLLNYMDILGAVEGYMETNMTPAELKALIRMQTDDMASWDVIRQNIKGTTSSEYCYSVGQYALVVLQDQASISAAIENINAVMAGNEVYIE